MGGNRFKLQFHLNSPTPKPATSYNKVDGHTLTRALYLCTLSHPITLTLSHYLFSESPCPLLPLRNAMRRTGTAKRGLKSNDLCPACKKYGVELEVAYHRDASASSSSSSFTSVAAGRITYTSTLTHWRSLHAKTIHNTQAHKRFNHSHSLICAGMFFLSPSLCVCLCIHSQLPLHHHQVSHFRHVFAAQGARENQFRHQ